ncbi:MAG: hypothetical protein LBG12_01925, partial [Synergistaceae bacterium]|nr:hypothetical protein [Synergistaceae bacterium]
FFVTHPAYAATPEKTGFTPKPRDQNLGLCPNPTGSKLPVPTGSPKVLPVVKEVSLCSKKLL